MLKLHPEENIGAEVSTNSAASKPTGNVVEIKGLTKRYGKKSVVDGLSLNVPKGCVYGLIGPNGAGKSTTLKSLMRLLRTSGGSMNVLGHDVTSDFQAVKHKIGYVPETHQIYRWMKIKRVIQFTRSFYPTWNEQFCDQMLQMMELDPEKKVKQLSKGMLAKLALLLAVSHEPELLVLDEPLSGLDPIVRDEFIDGVLKTICEQETTVIFSSHTIGDIQRLADSVGILYAGRLLVNESTETMLSESRQIKIVLNSETEHSLRGLPESTICESQNGRELTVTVSRYSPAMEEAIAQENSVEHISVERLNLEDLFKAHIRGAKLRTLGKSKGVKDV